MSRPYTCSVKNCGDKTSSRHRFPNPQKEMARFKLWVKACNNKRLDSLSPQGIYKKKRICHIHFSRRHRGTNNFILSSAIPTLFLPINEATVTGTLYESEEFSANEPDAELDEDPLSHAEGTDTTTNEVQDNEMLSVAPPLLLGICPSGTIQFNNAILNKLKQSVEKLQDHEKCCVLMFDEKSHLQMNIDKGDVIGFQHFGEETTNLFANTVTVFMIKGITKKWKQPVFYGFSRNGIKPIDLVLTVNEVIKRCQECGLRVVSTICDQGSSNVAAINYLTKRSVEEVLRKGETQEGFTFNVNGKKIIPIYDPPHLIKEIRNNLLTRNLIWEKGNNEKLTCKWKEIQQAYYIDNHSGELPSMPKLHDKHIFEHKMSKMEVEHATQVLSYTVASAIGLFAKTSHQAEDGTCLEKRAKETSQVLHFWDQLFDSCNGQILYPQHRKTLRCAVTKASPHFTFWKDAREILSQMYFQKEGSREKFIPPSLQNWIITLRGMELLVKDLLQEDVFFIVPRTFNQDCLKNFLGKIPHHSESSELVNNLF